MPVSTGPLRIALLTDGMWPFVIGGMQMHTYMLVRQLLQRGVQVDLYLPSLREEENDRLATLFSATERSAFTPRMVRHPHSLYFPGHYLVDAWVYSTRIADAMEKAGKPYDIIYIQGFAGWAHLTRASQPGKQRGATIINFHGLEMFQRPADGKQMIDFFFFRHVVKRNILRADYVQSLGGQLTRLIRDMGVPEKKILECSNGIGDEWVRSVMPSTINSQQAFLFIGRYEKRKGLALLYRAVKALVGRPLHIKIIGDIPAHARVDAPQISYAGAIMERNALQKELDQHTFLLLPSLSEGLPTVALEAMARGCIVIGTHVGALETLLRDDNAIIIDPVSPSGVQAAIEKALSMTEAEIVAMRHAAIATIARSFKWSVIANQMTDAFMTIAGKEKKIPYPADR